MKFIGFYWLLNNTVGIANGAESMLEFLMNLDRDSNHAPPEY